MGVREGGSYVADSSGSERLVERTNHDVTPRAVEAGPAPEVMSAPAAPIADPAPDDVAARLRRLTSEPQE